MTVRHAWLLTLQSRLSPLFPPKTHIPQSEIKMIYVSSSLIQLMFVRRLATSYFFLQTYPPSAKVDFFGSHFVFTYFTHAWLSQSSLIIPSSLRREEGHTSYHHPYATLHYYQWLLIVYPVSFVLILIGIKNYIWVV